MAQSGFTPIKLYLSTTAAAVPTAANLEPGELALNNNDGKLFYEDSSGVVQVIATKAGSSGDVVGPASATNTAVPTFDGTTGKLIQNNSGVTIATNIVTATGFAGALNGTVGATTPAAGAFTTLSATGITTVAAGSAALPAIVSTTGTADTGLWFPAADTIAASTAGTERLRIDSSGNVGVNTSTPTTFGGSLVVYAAANPISVIASGSANAYLRLYSTSDNNMYLANLGGSMAMLTANTERMRIDSVGNVGIGTSSPGAKLAVVGTGYSPAITLTDGATLNWDTSLGQVAQVTLGGNRTFAAPTNLVNGGFYSLLIIQDGTGSRTISWNAVFDFAGGTAPTLSTAAGSKDLITWRSDGTNLLEVGRSLGVA